MNRLHSASAFFPSLNDALVLPYLIAQTDETLRQIADIYEIIVINDGSTDDTDDVLESLKNTYPALRTIRHPGNLGYGAALISGFRAAKYEWIFYTDGDGQYDPHDLIKLIHLANKRIDVVNGIKSNRSDTLTRVVIGKIYNVSTHLLFRLPIADVDCDFRLIRKKLVDRINLHFTSGAICLELILNLMKVGARFAEVQISHHERRFGKSEFFKINHIMKTTADYYKIVANRIKLTPADQ